MKQILLNDITAKRSVTIVSEGLSPDLCRQLGFRHVWPCDFSAYVQQRLHQQPDLRVGILRQSTGRPPTTAKLSFLFCENCIETTINEESMMKIGCAALYPITRYGFPYSLDDYLKAIADMHAAGFHDCELEINVDIDLADYESRIDEVKASLAQHEMTLSAVIGVVHGGFSMDKALADSYMARFDRFCRFISGVGCKTACICAYIAAGDQGRRRQRGLPRQPTLASQGSGRLLLGRLLGQCHGPFCPDGASVRPLRAAVGHRKPRRRLCQHQ